MALEEIEYKLTQYSRSAGCGCKIAPAVLEEILHTSTEQPLNERLLTSVHHNEDAAAYDMGNGTALISTTDFFMPIVDDAYDFGRIAAANSISDVYAMGGKPIMAIAILGWPVEKLPPSLARQVIEGARSVCAEAGIPLAGGHSVDATEPIFGLAVNGVCAIKDLKRNSTAMEGDLLFLTKPIGMGIIATAQKRGLLTGHNSKLFVNQLTQLNKVGECLGNIPGVTAMTDVTGFGLAGHLIEMAEGSGLSVELFYARIPVAAGVKEYLAQRVVPDATYRNWNAYHNKISFDKDVNVMEAFSLLPDPQTNGGLLIAVRQGSKEEVIKLLEANGYSNAIEPVGVMVAKQDKVIYVK